MTRLGVFGGSFSPPHLGHFGAARAFQREAELDRLLVIPALIPPHKSMSGIVEGKHRLAMCRLAFGEIPKTEISDIELRRDGKSYTYLTLRELAGRDRELFLLCGTDMMLTLDSWAMPEEIFRLAHIYAASRLNDPGSLAAVEEKKQIYEDKFGARITLLHNPVLEVSSTELRKKLTDGEDTGQLLDRRVKEYIGTWNLYNDFRSDN